MFGLLGAAAGLFDTITNAGIAQQNLAWQREAQERNEALTRESWARDDSAVTRRAQDLRNAGINPLLAAGSAASNTSPIKVDALHSDYKSDALAKAAAVMQMRQQFAQGRAELRNIDADTAVKEATASNLGDTNAQIKLTVLDRKLDALQNLQDMVLTGRMSPTSFQKTFAGFSGLSYSLDFSGKYWQSSAIKAINRLKQDYLAELGRLSVSSADYAPSVGAKMGGV